MMPYPAVSPRLPTQKVAATRRRIGTRAAQPFWLMALVVLAAFAAPAAEQVIISEFMASNTETLLDGYKTPSDWIEIYNAGDTTVNLAGWTLTDDAQNLTKWTFPARTLAPGQFLLVFASGNGAPDPTGQLHANFQLNGDGEYLALVRPDRSIATDFAPAYPPQRDDVSFGLAQQVGATTLVRSGARAQLLVPTALDETQVGSTWTGGNEPFADASWLSVTNPVGYDSASLTPTALVNAALGRPVIAAGETWPGLPKENLTDGNLSTFTHNNDEVPDFYYIVDLGGLIKLENIELFNRNDGCCPERLSNYTVSLHDDTGPTPGPAIWSADIRVNGSNSGNGGRDAITPNLDPNGVFAGRWIKVQARSTGGARYFQIAELRANAANWAGGATVLASGPTVGGAPKENLTDGNLSNISHNLDVQPAFAYQIRLTQAVAFTRLEVFNRNDGCCPDRLSNYRVSVHTDNAGAIGPVVWSAAVRTDGSDSGVGGVDVLAADLDPTGSFEGRWIQVQNLDLGVPRYLQIAEVRALGLGGSSGYSSVIRRSISAEMKGVNSGIWLRTPFTATNASGFDQATLRVKYDDGFVAYLNGTEVARANAPAGTPPYNAHATAPHFASAFQDFLLPPNSLREGTNILACRGLNLSADDRDFLLFPELTARRSVSGAYGYFQTPTAGRLNSSNNVAGFVDDPRFSIDRGFFDAPIDVIITSPSPGATLVYTTNATNPSLTNGFVRVPPDSNSSISATVRVATTTILRAAAFRSGLQPSAIDTHTYLFLRDVIRQPSNPPGFPAAWSGSSADYAMDPEVVTNAAYSGEILADMRSIPTMSIVVHQPDLFGALTGIYYNSSNVGDAWERAASVELIQPDGTTAFTIRCGLRIWGTGWRPNSTTPKHALQLKFQDQYGPKKLRYPLFPDAPIAEFDNLVLRAQGSKGWTDFRQPDIQQTQYIHDAWARDTCRDMGKIDGHATFVHLYLNGLYWGLYNPVEKTDDGFGEVYYGGDKNEYDVITRRDVAEADAGDLTAWNQMMSIVNGPSLASPEQYALLQQYLDVDAFIDHMMLHQYASNHDGPTFGIANNMRALRRRVPGGQFRFHVWDMEYTFWYPFENNLSVDTDQSPARIFQRLRANPEFRLRYGDRAQRHLTGNGALTPGPAAARWQARANEIFGAVVGESARWGDVRRPSPPYTRNVEWTIEFNRLMNEYFPVRTQVYLDQLKVAGLFPNVVAPTFQHPGGDVPSGFQLHISAPDGTVYYTLDGTDPRVAGGAILPSATAYTPTTFLVTTSNPVRIRVPTSPALGSSWNGSESDFDDSTWLSRPNAAGFDASVAVALSPIPLQNASADFSEISRGANLALDANPTSTGWGIFEQGDYVQKGRSATAVFETITNVGYAEGTRLVFTLRHGLAGQLSLGKFRISATTSDRSEFADALTSRGDIVADWIPLHALTATAAAGGTITINGDHTLLLSGTSPSTNVYTITVVTSLRGITGFRIEAMEHTTLPANGPGRAGNGNAVLTDFSVQAAPATLSHLVEAGAAAQLQSAMQNANASLYMRIPFTVAPGALFHQLLLRARYEDGFVAYLNGQEVARRNAPASLAWNSTAAMNRARGEALDFETIDLGPGLTNLLTGENILALQALNESAGSSDFMCQPELIAKTDIPIPLADGATVKARVLLNGEWSALSEATYVTRVPLRFSEIMYHPPASGTANGDEFEFIELQNTGSTAYNLSGLLFTSGINFGFTNGTFLAPGQFFLLVRNPAQFATRYPGVPVHGVFTGRLDDGGETLTLSRPTGATVLSVTYGDAAPWPVTPDGFGFSLVAKEGAAALSESSQWQASAEPLGSPGSANPEPNVPSVVVNEVLSATSALLGQLDSIELYNPTSQEVDVGGWFLTDQRTVPVQFRIPLGTRIPAGGYVVFDEDDFNPAPGTEIGFVLDASGEVVYLFSADAAGNLTGYSHGLSFGAAAEGVSFGGYVISTGEEQFPPQTSLTLGGPNAGPRIGPVVVNEIMYNPPPGGDEFIELKNITSSPVPLFDPDYPTNTWSLGGLNYSFPTNQTLAPNALMLLVPTAPAEFRAKYGVAASVLILGPYVGQLQNSGERLALAYPDTPIPGGVPAIVVDEVRYNDKAPWPELADGFGPSLQRPNSAAYGNDPANWRSAAPSPGREFAGGLPPSITVEPTSQTVVRYKSAQLTVGASGTAPLSYQWQLLGTNVPGATGAILTITNVQLTQAGPYRATVFNSAGATTSTVAVLTVLNPPTIVVQPQSRVVAAGSNLTLSVTAIGNGPLQYQWHRNGTEISGATLASLTLTGIQEDQGGNYTVIVTDAVGSVLSQPATVQVYIRPVITESPASVTAVVGDTVVLRVSATGTFPLTYRWRRGGAFFTNITLYAGSYALIITNVQLSQATTYSVTVTNLIGTASTTNAVLTVLADTDGDHMADIWETIAGTDPNNPASYLSIDTLKVDSTATLSFSMVSNKTYTVQYRDRFGAGSWTKLVDLTPSPTNRIQIVVDPQTTSTRYYRLATP